MKYMADDGTVFSTEAECLAYENNPMKQLTALVKDKIDRSYSDVAGIQIIEESAVLNFIVSHIDEINKILNEPKQVEPSNWISNIGNTRAHYPDSLSFDTEIEVKFRIGETGTGIAGDNCWGDVGSEWDIVAYRVI